MAFRFPHENLDCYKLAVEVARWFQQASFPKGRTELKQQGQEAADSIVLNIAEGSGRRRGATDAGKSANHRSVRQSLRTGHRLQLGALLGSQLEPDRAHGSGHVPGEITLRRGTRSPDQPRD